MKPSGGGALGRAGRAPSTGPSATSAARATAATRAIATTRALQRSGREGLVAAVAPSTEQQTAAHSCRASLGPCSAGRCGRPSPGARRGRRGSHRRSPCALCTAAAGPGVQAATLSTAPGRVLPASAWHPDSRATDGVKTPLLASTSAPAGARWGVGGRTGVPASSRSRARSSSVEGPAGAGDSIVAARHASTANTARGAWPLGWRKGREIREPGKPATGKSYALITRRNLFAGGHKAQWSVRSPALRAGAWRRRGGGRTGSILPGSR